MDDGSTKSTPESRRPHPTQPGRTLIRHDHIASHQVCGDCGLVISEGLATAYDEQYFAGEPSVCPRCGGDMGWMFERQENAPEDADYILYRRADGTWTRHLPTMNAKGVLCGARAPANHRIADDDDITADHLRHTCRSCLRIWETR